MQNLLYPLLTLSHGKQIFGPRPSYFAILSSLTPPAINKGGLVLQDSDVQSSLNQITAIFSCNFALPKGAIVEIRGLTGSNTPDTKTLQAGTDIEVSAITSLQGAQTPDSIFLSIIIESTTCNLAAIDLFAEWYAEPGTLRFIMPCHVPINCGVLVYFTLQNLASVCPKKRVFIFASSPETFFSWTPMVGAVLGPQGVPNFAIFAVAESSQEPNQKSVILLVLQPNIPLPTGAVIEINGLVGFSSASLSAGGAVALDSSTENSGAQVGSEWESR